MTTYTVGYGKPPAQLSLSQLNLRGDWAKLHPEFRRRLLALMDASAGKVGFGGGWRSSAAQELLFRTRYTPSDRPPGISWAGQYWTLKPGNASAAPPGMSFHESTIDGLAVAADMIGDLAWMGAHAVEFGLRDFSDVNDEPWHVQPSELPNSRRTYNVNPARFPLLGPTPKPPPAPTPVPPQEDDMILTNAEPWFGAAPGVAKFVLQPNGRLRLLAPVEWDALCHGTAISNAATGELGVDA